MPREYDLGIAVFQLESEVGGMTVSNIKRLRELEEENRQLKRMFADPSLENREFRDFKWFGMDFGRGLIQVRVNKSNRKRLLPMNETIRMLLSSMEKTSEFVFPSPKTNNRLNQIKRSFGNAVKKLK